VSCKPSSQTVNRRACIEWMMMSYPLYSEAVVEGMEDMIDAVGLFTSSVGRTVGAVS
jgi:hypothetical protein